MLLEQHWHWLWYLSLRAAVWRPRKLTLPSKPGTSTIPLALISALIRTPPFASS
jgi:hypothetical protein